MFHHLSLFLQGFAVGIAFTFNIISIFSFDPPVVAAVMLAVGVAGGLLSLVLRRWGIIVATAVFGALLVVQALFQLIGELSVETMVTSLPWYGLLPVMALAGGGIFLQHKYTSELDFSQLAAILRSGLKNRMQQLLKRVKDKKDKKEEVA